MATLYNLNKSCQNLLVNIGPRSLTMEGQNSPGEVKGAEEVSWKLWETDGSWLELIYARGDEISGRSSYNVNC